MAGRGVRMRMPSRPKAIAPMIERILAAVEPAGFSDGQRHDLSIALSEALANAVVHGNRSRDRTLVSVAVVVDPRRSATITIRDSGAGFTRRRLPDPRRGERLLQPSGRGVFLMRRLMDDVAYNRKGNEVRLTLRRRARRRVA